VIDDYCSSLEEKWQDEQEEIHWRDDERRRRRKKEGKTKKSGPK